MARRRKAKTGIKVDMSEVEARVTLPEGDYKVKVAEVTEEEGQQAPYLKWKFEVVGGKHDGSAIYDNTSLSTNALWRLANLLTAMGVKVPKGELELEFEELKDLEVMVAIHHEDYEGRAQARIGDYYPVDGDDEDEDEKPAKKGKVKAKSRDEDDEEEDEDEKPARKSRGKAKPKDDDEDEEDEEEEAPKSKRGRKAKPADDDDEEDEKPARKGKGKKKAKPDEDAVHDMDEDELAEVIEEHDLDVDLSDYKTLRKKAQAVIDALEDA